MDYITKLQKFITDKQSKNEEYFEYEIDKNIKIWSQKYFGDTYLEIQFKKENETEFENCIAINDYLDNFSALAELVKEYQTKISIFGIDNFLKENKDYFL